MRAFSKFNILYNKGGKMRFFSGASPERNRPSKIISVRRFLRIWFSGTRNPVAGCRSSGVSAIPIPLCRIIRGIKSVCSNSKIKLYNIGETNSGGWLGRFPSVIKFRNTNKKKEKNTMEENNNTTRLDKMRLLPTPQASDWRTKRTSKSWKAKNATNWTWGNPDIWSVLLSRETKRAEIESSNRRKIK